MPGILMRNGKVLFDIRTGKILWGEPEDACCCQRVCGPDCMEAIYYEGGFPIGPNPKRYRAVYSAGGFSVGDWYLGGTESQEIISEFRRNLETATINVPNPSGAFPITTVPMGKIFYRVDAPDVACFDENPHEATFQFRFNCAAEYAGLFYPGSIYGSTYQDMKLVITLVGGPTTTINSYGFGNVVLNTSRTFTSPTETVRWVVTMYRVDTTVEYLAQFAVEANYFDCPT
jgi:hypothetical protein